MSFHQSSLSYYRARLALACVCFLLSATSLFLTAHAASIIPVDPNNPDAISVEANEGRFDNLNQVYELRGAVTIKRGGMLFEGEVVLIKQDKKGFKNMELKGSKNKLAHFRHERPETGALAEGFGQTIEFDGLTDVVKLVKDARITRYQNAKQTEDVTGALITYNSRTEFFHLKNADGQKNNRVQIMIQPRN